MTVRSAVIAPREGRNIMMLSAITGIGSPNFISNITEASFRQKVSGVNADVTKQPPLLSDYDSFSFSSEALNMFDMLGSGEEEDTTSLLGSKTSTNPSDSYGLSADTMRQRGMMFSIGGGQQSSQQDTTIQAAANNGGISAISENKETSPQSANTNRAAAPQAPGVAVQNPGAEESPAAGQTQSADETDEETATKESEKNTGEEELSDEDKSQLRELKKRDTEVRTHEQAHLAASGGHATSGASYTYQKGPDGQNYAIGGEVSIDTSAESTPEATIQKMATVQKAALAPASPSGQDRSVAASAAQAKMQAQQELAQQRANPEEDEQSTDVEESSESKNAEKSENRSAGETVKEEESNQESGMLDVEQMQQAYDASGSFQAQSMVEQINQANQTAPVSQNNIERAALSVNRLAAISAYGLAV